MAVSADPQAANVCLDTVRALHAQGLRTCLGVSNISFGLPARGQVTASFFAMAIREGLSAAIMNPLSDEMQAAYHAARVLCGKDPGCRDYLRFAQAEPKQKKDEPASELSLHTAIVRGLRGAAAQAARSNSATALLSRQKAAQTAPRLRMRLYLKTTTTIIDGYKYSFRTSPISMKTAKRRSLHLEIIPK